MSDLNAYVLSRPFRVFWAGWETDTFSLQKAGWRLAARVDQYQFTVELGLYHPMLELRAVTNAITLQRAMSWTASHLNTIDFGVEPAGPVFVVREAITREITVRQMQTEHSPSFFSEFEEIDARPQMDTVSSMRDFPVFAKAQQHDVLFDQADMTVVDHLEAIKALQSDKQRELREKQRRAAKEASKIIEFPQQRVVARLVNLEAS